MNNSSAMSKNQKLTLASTSAGFALQNIDYGVISMIMAPMIASLGISKAAGGLVTSVTNIGMLVGGVLLGLLADKFGRVKIFTYTLILFAISTGAMYFANNIYLIYLLRFIGGFTEGGEYGAGVSLVAENFSHQRIGKLISLTSISGQIGTMITAGVAAFVIPKFGWHALFLIGLIPAAFAFIIRTHLKESPHFVKESHSKDYTQKVSLKQLFLTKKMSWQTIALMIMVVIQVSGYYGLINWLPSIMQKQMHISVSQSSLWMVVTIIGMSLGMWVFGTIMDHFSPRLSYGIFLLIAAAAVYLITIAFNAWTLLLACTVVGFFTNGMYAGYGAIISRLYPMNIRATANNLIMNIGGAIGGFAPVVIGILWDNYSLVIVMIILSAMYLVSFCTMFTIPNLKKLSHKVSNI